MMCPLSQEPIESKTENGILFPLKIPDKTGVSK